ncbi:hypothetical protein NLU13_5547 [Sarocladium strictum]|uniref:BZIP domain-containing protein n=1 Tax=Sarocladium strictum TaxID=5046 RepID=A0AA39GIR2_SARSR|nr:hypothetical protein NLU13_5547 [Sarocladium strictum]
MGSTDASAAAPGASKSPKKTNKSPPRKDTDAKTDSTAEASTNADAAAKPLAPPPRPAQQQGNNTPDYFTNQPGGSLSLEPNPFEQSFGGGSGPETPGGTKLPSVASLTSPSSLLPGSNATPFNWGGGSLRTGPLSPAMLSGPTSDYFSDTHHLRGGFPTPNESGLRSGLTPGGSGSMFPAPSPNSQALFNQLASGGATPSTLDFHRTALSAAAKREQTQASTTSQPAAQPTQPEVQQPAITQSQDMTNGVPAVKSEPKSFDPHDNDAANGLFMLAQGAQQRNGAPNGNHFTAAPVPVPQPHPATINPHVSPQMSSVNGGSVGSARGVSEGSNMSDESEPRPSTRGKGKRSNSATNGRKKTDDGPVKAPPSKKSKANNGGSVNGGSYDEPSDGEDDGMNEDGPKGKMTDEEKRKNFLERNRVAALKCRQRKKQWLANLQTKVEMFSSENDALTAQITQLREEVVSLKTLLLAHKDCPVTQQQGLHGAFMSQVAEPYSNTQMNPYGMAVPMGGQPVMAGQGHQRRFS